MKIIFKHDINKDTENFIKSTKSINSKEPTKLFLLFSGEFNNPTIVNEIDVRSFLENYIQKNNIKTDEKTNELQNRWNAIEAESIVRLEKIFKMRPYIKLCLAPSMSLRDDPDKNRGKSWQSKKPFKY